MTAPDPNTGVVHDARLGAVSMAQPDSDGHLLWIAGLGYGPADLPLLVAFIQTAMRTHNEATARGTTT